MGVVGVGYLERGERVVVLAQWRTGASTLVGYGYQAGGGVNDDVYLYRPELGKRLPGSGPRNVLIRRGNGDLVVRPFRGLRKVVQE